MTSLKYTYWTVEGIWLNRKNRQICFFFGKDLINIIRAQHGFIRRVDGNGLKKIISISPILEIKYWERTPNIMSDPDPGFFSKGLYSDPNTGSETVLRSFVDPYPRAVRILLNLLTVQNCQFFTIHISFLISSAQRLNPSTTRIRECVLLYIS